MVAVVNTSHGQVALEKRPVPCIKATEVLVRVHSVAVCGSEIHQWHGTHSWPVRYPVILGHEFSGAVEDVGEEVRGFMCGDRVVSETAAVINPQSEMVRRGLYNLDPDRQGFGYGVDGAMASHVAVPARCLHHVPSEVDLLYAALTEPCCVAYNAVVNHADVRPGDRVLVLGPGPIGILCGMLASLHGADRWQVLAGVPDRAVYGHYGRRKEGDLGHGGDDHGECGGDCRFVGRLEQSRPVL